MSSTPLAESRPFFGRVESLRGLGVLAVSGYHIAGCAVNGIGLLPDARWLGAGPVQNGIRQFGTVALFGHAALMTFFVISGFVLRLSLEHGPQRPAGAVARFLLARVFRLYPIVFFAAVLLALASPVPARVLVANMLLLDVSMNGTLWALQVELLMAPVIVALYFFERSRGSRALILVALFTTALAFKPSWAGWPPLSTNLFAFVLGMLIPTVGRKFVARLSRRGATAWVAVAVAAAVLANPCFGRYSRFSTVIEAYAAFALVSLIAYRLDVGALKWLDIRPIRLVGLASGSYYVLHMATVPLVLNVIAPALIPAAWSAAAPALVGCPSSRSGSPRSRR